jgi:AraC-like DNA-binding protein
VGLIVSQKLKVNNIAQQKSNSKFYKKLRANIHHICSGMGVGSNDLLIWLFDMCVNHPVVQVTQKTLAQKASCSMRTVKRLIRAFERMNVLEVTRGWLCRTKRKINIYRVNFEILLDKALEVRDSKKMGGIDRKMEWIKKRKKELTVLNGNPIIPDGDTLEEKLTSIVNQLENILTHNGGQDGLEKDSNYIEKSKKRNKLPRFRIGFT